jgi:hypothetical protein
VEVEKDLAKLAAEQASATEIEKEPVKSKGRPLVRGQIKVKGRIQARIDTGLRKKELEVEEEKKKVLGKENVPKKTKQPPKVLRSFGLSCLVSFTAISSPTYKNNLGYVYE